MMERHQTNVALSQGFLRRVHRWPILLPEDPSVVKARETSSSLTRARVQSSSNAPPSHTSAEITSPVSDGYQTRAVRGRLADPVPIITSISPEVSLSTPGRIRRDSTGAPRFPIRKSSAAERILEKLQLQPRGGIASPNTSPMKSARDDNNTMIYPRTAVPDTRRHSAATFLNLANAQNSGTSTSPLTARPRFSRSPSAPSVPLMQASNSQGSVATSTVSVPPELLPLLDGEHHTDELATRFEIGWPLLEQWLITAGGGKGDGDFGRVLIIYR